MSIRLVVDGAADRTERADFKRWKRSELEWIECQGFLK